MAKSKSQAQDETEDGDKMLKATISGYYGTYDNKIINFRKVVGVLPFVNDKGVARMHIQGRYAVRFLEDPENVDGKGEAFPPVKQVFQCHIDKMEETSGVLSFVGKNIKDLELEEIQDLATQKDLRFIPLPTDNIGWADMLVRAYVAYSDKILKRKIKWQSEDFNFEDLPDITLNGDGRLDLEKKITNEEMISREQQGNIVSGSKDDPKQRFTLDELKTMADGKSIDYVDDVSFEDLYKRLFSGG